MSEERRVSTLWEFWSTGSAPPLRWQSQPGAFFGFVLSLLLNPHPREVKCAISRVSRVQLTTANLTVASANGAEPIAKVLFVTFGETRIDRRAEITMLAGNMSLFTIVLYFQFISFFPL